MDTVAFALIMSSNSIILTENDINNFYSSKNSLSKVIYERLVSMLMNSELSPGLLLSRQQLARELGVSVAPVLEALIQLELDGFVESIPKKGTIIKAVSKKNFYERFVLREALECAAARIYRGQLIRENKKELLSFAQRIDRGELYSLPRIKDDIVFHASLVNLTRLPVLTREFLKATRIGIFCMQNLAGFTDLNKIQNHPELVEKLATDDPDTAEKAIREHIWGGDPSGNPSGDPAPNSCYS